MAKRLLRLKQVQERLPFGRTFILDKLVKTGRLPPVKIGERAVAFTEDDVNRLYDEIVAEGRKSA